MLNSAMHIAIVVSQFNETITDKLRESAISTLIDLDVLRKNIHVVNVPGAIEIPLTAKLLAQSKKYQAVICLGAVIRGETSHYDYVCQQVSQGCQQVMLAFDIPIIFGVLTTKNEKQALERVTGLKGNKGKESAEAAIHMIKAVRDITTQVAS